MNNEQKHIKLSDLTNEHPFKVPEGYFETFNYQIITTIEEQQLNKKQTGIIYLLKPILSVAASIVIVFILLYYPMKTITSKLANNEFEFTEFEYLAQNYINDHEVIESFDISTQQEPVDEIVIESILLASMSEIELMELN